MVQAVSCRSVTVQARLCGMYGRQRVTEIRFSLSTFGFSPGSITSPMLHTHTVIWHQYSVISAIGKGTRRKRYHCPCLCHEGICGQ
jgi:hypothetical protein